MNHRVPTRQASFHTLGSDPVPEVVNQIADGREFELVWRNQLGGLTFRIEDHPLGIHFWRKASGWSGQDIVMAQRPGEPYSVWFFGEVLYINLQDPMIRTSIGFDTFDHELDIIVLPDGTWSFKDDDKLEASIEIGRFDANQIANIRREGARIGSLLGTANTWWTQPGADFRKWTAPENCPVPTLPDRWQSVS